MDDFHLWRFADLKERRIVGNWPQLKRLVDNHGFPAGFLLTPAVRVWPVDEVQAWVESRRPKAAAAITHADA